MKLTFHPVVGVAPELVTVTESWKPPHHEFTTDQLAWQAAAPVPAAVGVGVAVRVGWARSPSG